MGEVSGDKAELGPGLRLVRRRRLYLWGVIGFYLPAMWLTLRVNPTYRALGTVFFVWFVLLFATALAAAVAPCPRCGNYFHMHGMTLLPLRKCLHCQLHITADRKDRTV